MSMIKIPIRLRQALTIVMTLFSLTIWGQTSFTSNPSTSNWTGCSPSGSIPGDGCAFTYYGGFLDLRVSAISGNQITFQVKPCSGTFNSAVFYLKESTSSSINTILCGTSYPSSGVTIPNGSTTYSYNFTPNFTSGTRYYSVVVIFNGTSRAYTNKISVTATATVTPPTASTNNATFITSNSARLNGSVNPNGTLTGYIFEYGTSTNYGNSTPIEYIGSGTSAQNVYADISGLQPNTTYNFRIKAVNSQQQVVFGANKTFTTNVAGNPPTVSTGTAGNVTATSATLNGTVNPNNAETAYLFEYGTTISYGTQTIAENVGSGNSTLSVNKTISGLQPNTTYHYRIYAGNEFGYVTGNDMTFNTSQPATIYSYIPSLNTFTQCGSGIVELGALDYNSCTNSAGTFNYLSDNVKVALISHNTGTGDMTFRIKKCSGYFVNGTTGKLFIRQGPDVWCSAYSITNATTDYKDISFTYSTSFTGMRQFEAFLINSPQTVKLYAGIVSVTANNSTSYITVTNPSAGNSWSSGNPYSITWNDNISENVNISLSKGGLSLLTINSSTPSNGNYNWTPPTNLQTGNDYIIFIKSVNNSTIIGSSGYFTINGQSNTDCIFNDCSSSLNCGTTNYQDETYAAVQYLCDRGIVEGINNNALPDIDISRDQLAKIAFYGMFGDFDNVPAQLVSDFFPSPYADLQDPTNYYYRAAKALLYLQYNDAVTPFDRGRFNFNPEGNIERNLVLKVLLEAFNIAPATGGQNPFSDFQPTEHFWGYAKKAHEMGITSESLFRPYEYCTRAEAFIFLHRLMTTVSLPAINNTLDLNTSSFFIPINMSIAGMAANLGIEAGNFNHYTKSCFAIPGRNVSLDFDFTYHSYLTEFPSEVFPIEPLGRGWSHTYNMYLNMVSGASSEDDKLIVHMPDGSLLVYKRQGSSWVKETEGNYNNLTTVSTTVFELKTKSQVVYRFEKLASSDVAFVLTSIKDRNNNTISVSYSAGLNNTRKISSVTDPAGRNLQFTYHANSNLLASVKDPLNRMIYFYYTDGKLTGFKDAEGQNTTYNYGTDVFTQGLLMSIQLPKGNVINNQYLQRKLTNTKFNNNSPTTITHNPNYVAGNNNFYKSTVTVPQQSGQSITTNYEMDKIGNITKADGNDALNLSSAYADASHPTMPSSITNNKNSVTVTPTYGSNGNVTQIVTSGIGITTTETFQYNAFNDVTQHTNANNQTTYYTYNSSGNLIKVKDALNNETMISNNSYGQPVSITNPSGVTVNFGYNSYGNQNQVSIASLGLTSSMVYDAASRMTSATNFSGQTSTYTYDGNDNLLTETNAMNYTTSYAYDPNDNLTSITNAKGIATTFSYDNVTDWLLSESFQGAAKNYTYNDDGTLKTFQNPNGTTLSYTYDNSGRITNDGYATYTYATNGNLSSITKAGKAVTFGYDGLNRVTSVTYDGNTVTYTYDNVGNVLTMTYPGNKVVNYTYDAINNLKTVKDWNNNTTTYNYRPDGQLADMVYPNGVKTTYTYDNAGRPTGISTKRNNGGGTVVAEYAFTLDNLGNHTQESIVEQYTSYPAIPNGTVNYTYNNANRIQSAGNISFGFDINGNTTSKTGSAFAYDVLNNLTSVSGNFNASYVYDGSGNRREATRNGVVTKYVLDILGMSNVLMETNSSGTAQNYYIYGLGLVSRIQPNNATHYYVYDYRGSTVAMVDATTVANVTHKYQYDDFGNLLQMEESDYNPFRYVGKYGVMYENNELQFMRARYYDPAIGRFLSEDPIWSTNLYPYTNNNPINFLDFNGKYATKGDVEAWNSMMKLFKEEMTDGLLASALKKYWLALKMANAAMTTDQNMGPAVKMLGVATEELLGKFLSAGKMISIAFKPDKAGESDAYNYLANNYRNANDLLIQLGNYQKANKNKLNNTQKLKIIKKKHQLNQYMNSIKQILGE